MVAYWGHFTWDGTRLVEQETSGEMTRWTYRPGGFAPLTQSRVDAEFFAIVTDLVGSPVELVDPGAGEVVGSASADLWGRTIWQGESTPLRFPGQYFDDESGLHYNLHRYYDPALGRYVTQDPLGLRPAPNPSAYPHNPTGWIDPLGLTPEACGSAGVAGMGYLDSSTYEYLYRGVYYGHPAHADALDGVAVPWGGHHDPHLHNQGDNNSIFTSWTVDESIAQDFARSGNGPGVVLQMPNVDGPTYTRVPSPDAFGEFEVLIAGPVRNAEIR
ncbi:RHS repeat-associated core domain-containing protein [Rhodococcus sp. NPDC003322]